MSESSSEPRPPAKGYFFRCYVDVATPGLRRLAKGQAPQAAALGPADVPLASVRAWAEGQGDASQWCRFRLAARRVRCSRADRRRRSFSAIDQTSTTPSVIMNSNQ
jgi:hypothetical protein